MTPSRAFVPLRDGFQGIVVLLARSLNGFLEWLFASKNPGVVHVREAIRGNRILLFGARTVIRGVRTLPRLQQIYREKFKPTAVRRLEAIMAARMPGGSVTILEAEQIWGSIQRGSRVLVIADGPEREQVEAVLKAARAKAKFCCASVARGREAIELDSFDLIVVGPGAAHPEFHQHTADKVLRVGDAGRRSDYLAATESSPASIDAIGESGTLLQQKMRDGKPLRVVFLNDVGFQYGAGIALKRQVASLLLKGFEVAVMAWLPGALVAPPDVVGIKHFSGWLGVHSVNEVHASKGMADEAIVSELTARIAALGPDVVITGNLHGAAWSLALIPALRSRGIGVVAFMHDTYFVTGRCAQPAGCEMYRTGCDSRCPTPNEYPRLAPERIASAWRERGEIFASADPVPLIGNSQWTQRIAQRRFGSLAKTGFIHLALDHELFAPIPKAAARRLLGIPEGHVIVALGAVDVHNQWKGGPLFHELHRALLQRTDLALVLFGRSSETLQSLRSFGLLMDERMMPFILSAADIFVSTATAESFGQSLLEASACGIPVVAFDVGAVGEVVVDDETGLLVKELKVEALLSAIDRLVADPVKRESLGRAGRMRVENHFTLMRQADAWIDCLKRVC